MANEEVQEDTPKKKGEGIVIILVVVIVLLLGGMGALAYLLMSSDHKGANKSSEVAQASVGGHAQQYPAKYKQFKAPPKEGEPQYFAMNKFVVNFQGDGQAKFLAVDMKFMSYYPQLVGETGEMEHLRPILKNDIESLLRNQHYNALNTAGGPDELRKGILKIARKILEEHNIYPDLLMNVYLTRFVMQ
jgi:flagellar FliL protein